MNLASKILNGVALVSVLAGFNPIGQGQQPGNGSSQKTIEITAKRYEYDPDEITLIKGQPVTIVLKSTDVEHGLRIKEFDFKVESKPNHPESATLTPTKTGEFKGSCSHFCGLGHGSMKLAVKVVDAPAQ